MNDSLKQAFMEKHPLVKFMADEHVVSVDIEEASDGKETYAYLADGADDWYHMALTEDRCRELVRIFADLAELFATGRLTRYEEPIYDKNDQGPPLLHKYLLEVRTMFDERERIIVTAPTREYALSMAVDLLKAKSKRDPLRQYRTNTLTVIQRYSLYEQESFKL